MNAKAEQRQEASELLRKLFPVGSNVHTVVRHVTASGTGRSIQILSIDGDRISDVSYLLAQAGNHKLHPSHPGIKVQGCGMDMAFHLVYSLGRLIYGDGYALNKVSL